MSVLRLPSRTCSSGLTSAREYGESEEVSYPIEVHHNEVAPRTIAAGKPGVERVLAMQAGREVRVMVQPDAVDDLTAQMLPPEVAQQIEDELTYPGQIRITVVRETQLHEIAHQPRMHPAE